MKEEEITGVHGGGGAEDIQDNLTSLSRCDSSCEVKSKLFQSTLKMNFGGVRLT